MTQDEIIAMAREAGFPNAGWAPEPFAKFAALVEAKAAAKEREACAQIVRDAGFRSNGTPAYEHIADKISARGAA